MDSKKPYIEDYKGYLIADLGEGVGEDNPVGKTVVFLVEKNDTRAYFSFYDEIFDICKIPEAEDRFKRLAIRKIKNFVDAGKVENFGVYTFDLKEKDFIRVKDPDWWKMIAR